MPKITQGKTSGQIKWDSLDWLSGENEEVDSDSSTFLGNTLSSETESINPYSILGAAVPGALPVDVTNVTEVTDFLTNSIVKSNQAYGNSNDGKIHKFDGITGEVVNTGSFPHTIVPSSGSPIGDDIITYKVGDTDYAFYSWYSDGSNAQGGVGRYDFSTTFDDDNLSSTTEATSGTLIVGQRYLIQTFVAGDDFTNVGAGSNVTGVVFVATGITPTTWSNSTKIWKTFNPSKPLPMIIGTDDILYVADGNKVHGFDGQTGANGTLSFDVFKLPNQFEITSFAFVEPNLLAIFAYRDNAGGSFFLSEAKVFFWNYLDQDPVKVIDLNDNFVRAAFNFGGTVGCFTQQKRNLLTKEKKVRIRLYNGTIFKVVETVEDSIPLNGGIEVFSNHIMFNAQGNIYIYGSVKKGLNQTLHKITKKGTSSTMLKTTSSITTLVSSDVSNSRLSKLDTTKFINTANLRTISVFPPFPTRKKGKIKLITIVFSEASSGGRSIQFNIKVDINRIDKTVLATTTTIANTDLIQKFEEFDDGTLFPNDFTAIALQANWGAGSGTDNAPKIKEVIIDYDIIDIDS